MLRAASATRERRDHLCFVAFTVVAALVSGCLADTSKGPAANDPELGQSEGAEMDLMGPNPENAPKADRPLPYRIPELPALVSPEIIVSLDGLTAHLFDRATGFSRVYGVGVGRLGSSGRSITPVGHFRTSSYNDMYDSNPWFYMPARWWPAYYEGHPFLRLTHLNSRGQPTYGLHGPVTETLERGYVSNGCVRMRNEDIVEVFWAMQAHPGAPVTIQTEVELDRNGHPVDVTKSPALYAPGETIRYGASVDARGPSAAPSGPRFAGFIGNGCTADSDCGGYTGDTGAYCHSGGFCTQPCEGYCPDRYGHASTFCASVYGKDDRIIGVCASIPAPENDHCAAIPGTARAMAVRFIGHSHAPPAATEVCYAY